VKRTPLKRKTPLKAKKPISKVSAKQSNELTLRTKIKADLMDKAQGKCMMCGNPPDFRGLHLHHITHLSQGGKTQQDNLLILCAKCHSLEHGIKERNSEIQRDITS
jgi:5-methylcytosine-specific restriction endonuclease McrA